MKMVFSLGRGQESLADVEYVYIPLKLKPCPICGLKDALCISTKENYEERFKENNGAVLTMECRRCDLVLSVYDHIEADPSYEYMKGALMNKWNNREGELV